MRIVLVDDHEIIRAGLRALLTSQGGMEVVGEGANGAEAVRLASALSPDVMVMDLSMPDMNGVDATRQIRTANPAIQVVMLSGNGDAARVRWALDAGASGFVIKDSATEELAVALQTVVLGKVYLSPRLRSVLF